MKWKREIFGGQHEPLISKKLFDTCQEVMGKRGRVHEVHKNNFAFLGLLKCASCGASITAEKQKGHHYYRCTKKKGLCQEKYYLREEALTEQIKNFLQKVSLSSQDTEKVLAALDSEQDKAREDAQNEVSILKEQLSQVETKGLSWLEPAREFVKSLNQAANLLSSPNPSAMTTFLKNIGSNHILRNREFVFTPKIEYKLVAERGEANPNSLTFPTWCLYCTKLAPTSKTNDVARAERVVALNQIVRFTKAPPPPRFTRQPQKEKMFLAFRICARPIFSENGKDIFLFGVLPSKYSGRWRNNADEVLAKLFFGERICQNFGSFVFEFGCRKWKRRGLGRNFPFAPLISFGEIRAGLFLQFCHID